MLYYNHQEEREEAEMKYRVGYINDEGKKKAFRFESDKSFRSYGRSYSQGILGLGNPFVNDMMDEGVKHKGFRWDKIKFIKNLETGECKFY